MARVFRGATAVAEYLIERELVPYSEIWRIPLRCSDIENGVMTESGIAYSKRNSLLIYRAQSILIFVVGLYVRNTYINMIIA